jgi:hypothetical protein
MSELKQQRGAVEAPQQHAKALVSLAWWHEPRDGHCEGILLCLMREKADKYYHHSTLGIVSSLCHADKCRLSALVDVSCTRFTLMRHGLRDRPNANKHGSKKGE